MTTIDYSVLGATEAIRKRRFRILQLQMRGATPPEIAHTEGLALKTVYNDQEFLKTADLRNITPFMIKQDGTNFYEIKIRELQARIAAVPKKEVLKYSSYILGLEKLILQYKEESLKLLGAYKDVEGDTDKPIKIVFETVDARTYRRDQNGAQDPDPDPAEEDEE